MLSATKTLYRRQSSPYAVPGYGTFLENFFFWREQRAPLRESKTMKGSQVLVATSAKLWLLCCASIVNDHSANIAISATPITRECDPCEVSPTTHLFGSLRLRSVHHLLCRSFGDCLRLLFLWRRGGWLRRSGMRVLRVVLAIEMAVSDLNASQVAGLRRTPGPPTALTGSE
ncbi:hypothetical protein U1Q18_010690 [Sarracenia purpurea var. burkii]